MTVLRWLSALYLLGLCLAVVATALRPVTFQKSNSIRWVPGPVPEIRVRSDVPPFDVYRVLEQMPRSDLSMVWAVDPDVKYRETILGGRGNCSNLVFGLARLLDRNGQDFQILHFLKPTKFLTGKGHTVIRTRFRLGGRDEVGLVDIFAGGFPRSGGEVLDVYDLEGGPIRDFDFLSVNGHPERAARFYQEYLEEIEIGWIPAQEVSDYFDFIEAVYVPLGSRRLEKYLYDGLAVVLGYYPRIYVSAARHLASVNPLEWTLYVGVLWVFRSAFVVLPLIGVLEVRHRRRR